MQIATFLRRFPLWCALLALGAACAPTTEPLPPPAELLLVVNRVDGTLSILELPDANLQPRVAIGAAVTGEAQVAAFRRLALVATGGPAVSVMDLSERERLRVATFPAGSRIVDAAFLSDSVAFLADAGRGALVRFSIPTGDTASIPIGVYPNGLAFARGRLHVLLGNLAPCQPGGLCPLGNSSVVVVDPFAFARAGGVDSIPLPGEGNARFLRGGPDGFLYVMSEGNQDEPGRLAIVDPVRRQEIGNFGGFGLVPGRFTVDGTTRILVTSMANGLMEFDTRTRTVTRGVGSSIPVDRASGVAVDSRGLVYAVETGPCDGVSPGRVRIYLPGLTERRSVFLGGCATGALVALVPPSLVAPTSR